MTSPGRRAGSSTTATTDSTTRRNTPEAYAHNAVEQTKVRLKSETFDDYSYTAESSIIDVGKLGVESLLDDYVVVQPLNGVTMRLRSL